MTDDELLLAHARDLKTKSADNSMITATAFLDERQRSLISVLEKEQNKYTDTFYFGGYKDAVRTAAVFVPKFFETADIDMFFAENPDDCPFCLLRIDKDRFTGLSHRDYLGALMALGVKREMLGDLLVDENGCFVPCVKSVKSFIINQLESVGRASVKAHEMPFSEIARTEAKSEEMVCFVSSLRLDNAVSAAFSVSRTKAAEAIEKGLVFVNSVQSFKPDCKLSENCTLVLRGKGKAVLEEILGESKKGRLRIRIKKYL